MDSLLSLASKKVIQHKLASDCLEKLIEKAVVYVPVQLIKTNQKTIKRLDTYFLGAVYSTEEKAYKNISKTLKPENFKLLKYYLNPNFSIEKVFVFDTNDIPFVSNDAEHFKEMYAFHDRCNRCKCKEKINSEGFLSVFTFEVDKDYVSVIDY